VFDRFEGEIFFVEEVVVLGATDCLACATANNEEVSNISATAMARPYLTLKQTFLWESA
jgi:carbonic anhydrase